MNKLPLRITAIIRDEGPLVIEQPCSYRRVTVELTPEQRSKLACRWQGKNGGFDQFEQVSNCFLEFEP